MLLSAPPVMASIGRLLPVTEVDAVALTGVGVSVLTMLAVLTSVWPAVGVAGESPRTYTVPLAPEARAPRLKSWRCGLLAAAEHGSQVVLLVENSQAVIPAGRTSDSTTLVAEVPPAFAYRSVYMSFSTA